MTKIKFEKIFANIMDNVVGFLEDLENSNVNFDFNDNPTPYFVNTVRKDYSNNSDISNNIFYVDFETMNNKDAQNSNWIVKSKFPIEVVNFEYVQKSPGIAQSLTPIQTCSTSVHRTSLTGQVKRDESDNELLQSSDNESLRSNESLLQAELDLISQSLDALSSDSESEKVEIESDENTKLNSSVKPLIKEQTNMSTEADIKKTNSVDETKKIVELMRGVMDRFKVLKDLKGGYKICVIEDPDTKKTTFSIDQSYVYAVSRYLSGQNRTKIINILIDDANIIVENYDSLTTTAKMKVSQVISDALVGIRNMRQTYSDNEACENALSTVIQRIEGYAKYNSN